MNAVNVRFFRIFLSLFCFDRYSSGSVWYDGKQKIGADGDESDEKNDRFCYGGDHAVIMRMRRREFG